MSTTETATPIGIANVSLIGFRLYWMSNYCTNSRFLRLAPQPAVCTSYEALVFWGRSEGLIEFL
jgi:hypothetical protein